MSQYVVGRGTKNTDLAIVHAIPLVAVGAIFLPQFREILLKIGLVILAVVVLGLFVVIGIALVRRVADTSADSSHPSAKPEEVLDRV